MGGKVHKGKGVGGQEEGERRGGEQQGGGGGGKTGPTAQGAQGKRGWRAEGEGEKREKERGRGGVVYASGSDHVQYARLSSAASTPHHFLFFLSFSLPFFLASFLPFVECKLIQDIQAALRCQLPDELSVRELSVFKL